MPRPRDKKGSRNSIDCNTSTRHTNMYVRDFYLFIYLLFSWILKKSNHFFIYYFEYVLQVKQTREKFSKLDNMEMSIWECCELLNEVVDESDPDLDEPQIQHLLQSAEAIRQDYPDQDWLHLTALIHGNKIMTYRLLILHLSRFISPKIIFFLPRI